MCFYLGMKTIIWSISHANVNRPGQVSPPSPETSAGMREDEVIGTYNSDPVIFCLIEDSIAGYFSL